MGLPAGGVFEMTFEGRLCGQTVLNVFHYVVSVESAITNVGTEAETFLDQMLQAAPGSFRNDYVACMPSNWTFTRASMQGIYPTRYVRVVAPGGGTPGSRGITVAANIAGVITARTEFSGRNQIGAKHIPTGNDQDVADGLITAGFKAALATFALDYGALQTVVVGGGAYRPSIYHRANVVPKSQLIEDTIVQDTSRVMRRRTVGLGI